MIVFYFRRSLRITGDVFKVNDKKRIKELLDAKVVEVIKESDN